MMKKDMMKTVMTVLLLAAGTAGLCGQSPRAIIESVQGSVEIKAPGAAQWKTAEPGQELEQEALVSTGFNGFALIRVGNSTFLARPLSSLSLGELQAAGNSERVDIQLRSGRIRAQVKPPTGGNVDFTVRGPSITASVRGTVFEFDTFNLQVEEGTVYFSGADNTAVYVGAGQSSSPDLVSGRTAPPVEISSAQAPPPPAGVDELTAPPETIISGPALQTQDQVQAQTPTPDKAPVDTGFQWAE